jgi:primosomal protein N'
MNPAKYLESELADRIRFSLPPASAVIVIENSSENLSGLARRIRDEFQDVSVNLSHDTHSINVVVPYNREKDVTTSLRALQKVRSLKKLSLLRIEKNPVNL